jgi:hypothetical protein
VLALLIGLLTAAGLLTRGAWDLWAQSALFLLVVGGTGVWLAGRIAIGHVPVPPRSLLAWCGGLAALAALSAGGSPVSFYAIQSWRVLLLGLWIFCATVVVSKDDRAGVDQAIRAAAWTLMLLAFYQRWHDGLERPASALLNQNVFAGAILMLLPLAVQERDWLLSAGLLLCLWWTKSVGAWLGLSAALIVTRRGREAVGNYAGMGLLFVCLVAVYAKLQSPEVLNRWRWWSAAWRMAAARPLFGFGPGSYTYAAPSYSAPPAELSTLYAHEHFLETAAEVGWPFLLLWVAGLSQLLRRGAPHKRFGAIAILAQSLWDYALSIPGVFWLFCYFAASMIPQVSQGLNVRFGRKAIWISVALAAASAACWWSAKAWRADRLKAAAIEALRDGAAPEAVVPLLQSSLAVVEDPEAERALAELILLPSRRPTAIEARQAAAHLLRAARANPYRPSTWAALERVHDALGDTDTARRLRAEGEAYCPILRPKDAR